MRAIVFFGAASAGSLLLGCGPGTKSGDCKDQLEPGDLVITEVFADYKAPPGGAGTDEGKEWFEIYNASDRPVDLEGLTIVHGRPDGSKEKSHVMVSQTIDAGQYLTLGNATQELVPAYIDYGYAASLGDFFNSDGGKLQLKCGDSVVDAAEYQMVNEGHSRELTASTAPDYTLNDDQEKWCEAAGTEFETGNFGTPGGESDCTPTVVGQCNDGGSMRPVVLPTAGSLVITEVLPNPAGSGTDATQEWFEIQNTGTEAFDLNGLSVKGNSSAGAIDSLDCLPVEAGAFAVLAHNADAAMNAGLPNVDAVFPASVALAATNGRVEVLAGETSLDAITWTTGAASPADGGSFGVDPRFATTTGNDDVANFCRGTTPYGDNTNQGSPGMENPMCNLLPPDGMCSDGGTNRPIVKPTAGQLVITEVLPNPAGTGTDNAQEWFEIANTGATAFDLNGLTVKGNATSTSTVMSSDCKSIAAGRYGLFAHNADTATNGGLPAVDATFATGVSLAATNGRVEVLDGATSLDVYAWTTGASAPVEAGSWQLDPDKLTTTDNDVSTNSCRGTTPYGDMTNHGTPRAVNDVQCP